MQKAIKNKRFRWWKILVFLLLLLLLAVVLYVAYVLVTYDRIADNQELPVSGTASGMAQTGQEYTAVSYNIGFGAYTPDFTFFMDGGTESRAASKESVIDCVHGAADTALAFAPDIVLYQEVDTGSTRSWQVQQADLLDDCFASQGVYDHVFAENYHSAYLMYPITKPHGASRSGLLTLSNLNISSALRRSLPIATDLKKLLDLDRCYSISRIPVENGKELVLYNLHLSAYGTDAAQGNAQLKMLFEDLAKEYEAGNYIVCGGDFNHDFTGDSVPYFNNGSEERFTWCQPFPDDILPDGFVKCTDYEDGMVPSTRNTDIPYSEDSFTVTLDGFIVSDNVRCNYVQTVDTGFQYSDHNPVVLRFELLPAAE
ncbi:MAG: endonuclease/exonuclease/phosphatase family protein [Firmicutes bacterium]|nr:endonuclease/exonuclease/phosphatase family protein [Bacillota bacterium]